MVARGVPLGLRLCRQAQGQRCHFNGRGSIQLSDALFVIVYSICSAS